MNLKHLKTNKITINSLLKFEGVYIVYIKQQRKIHLKKIESLSKLVLNVFSLISVQLKILAVVKCGK